MTRNPLHRSIAAVLLGTFTLRFSTGLTGGLLIYYAAKLQDYGGPGIGSFELGVLTAAYFVAELTLSPAFGLLSDRFGAHRVMQWGPVFGAAAVIMTGLPLGWIPIAILLWLGLTRLLEGAAAGASIPSILGYIALATSGDVALRGQTVARFEAATLAGLGGGVVTAGALFDLIGPGGFFLNAGIYAVSLAIYRFGVADLATTALPGADGGPARMAMVRRRLDLDRYRRVMTSPGVWLLAPTWIALNAVVGAWTSQSIFQLVREPSRRFDGQLLMGGFTPTQVSAGMAAALIIFFAGVLFWGGRFKVFQRTTIILIGIGGGLVMLAATFGLNHSGSWGLPIQALLALVASAGLFVLAGGTPAALGLLADISETHPGDRGAIMGLYSVFLGVGQITGSLAGGGAAQWRGIDGLLVASLGLLVVAVLPIHRLRASEHLVGSRSDASTDRTLTGAFHGEGVE